MWNLIFGTFWCFCIPSLLSLAQTPAYHLTASVIEEQQHQLYELRTDRQDTCGGQTHPKVNLHPSSELLVHLPLTFDRLLSAVSHPLLLRWSSHLDVTPVLRSNCAQLQRELSPLFSRLPPKLKVVLNGDARMHCSTARVSSHRPEKIRTSLWLRGCCAASCGGGRRRTVLLSNDIGKSNTLPVVDCSSCQPRF